MPDEGAVIGDDEDRSVDSTVGPDVLRNGPFGTVLFVLMAISAYTPFALAVLAPFVIDDLDLSITQWGTLTGSIFLIGGLGAPIIGPIVDLLGGRRLVIGMYVVLAVSWIGMSRAPGFGSLLIATALSGVVRAASNPVGNHLVVHHAPIERRGVIMGISKAGAQMAGLLAGAVLPTAAVLLGWRGSLLAGLFVLFAGLAGSVAVIPAGAGSTSTREDRSDARIPRALYVWLAPHAFMLGFSLGQNHAFLPLYAVSEIGQTPARAGLIAATMAGFGIVGRVAWGRQAELFGTTALPLLLLSSGGVASTLMVAAASRVGVGMLWAGALLFGVTAFSWITVGMLAIIRESPRSIAGRSSGLILAMFYLGTALSPIALGALADASGSFVPSWLVSAGALTIGAVLAYGWHREILAEREFGRSGGTA